jgi:hypothetical protein
MEAAGAKIDGATLLARVYDVDALRCPRCGGRMRFLATITDRHVVARILDHVGLPSEPAVPARARDPTWDASRDAG